jgi:hypothetical protein
VACQPRSHIALVGLEKKKKNKKKKQAQNTNKQILGVSAIENAKSSSMSYEQALVLERRTELLVVVVLIVAIIVGVGMLFLK